MVNWTGCWRHGVGAREARPDGTTFRPLLLRMEASYFSAAVATVDEAASSNVLKSILFFISVPAKKLSL